MEMLQIMKYPFQVEQLDFSDQCYTQEEYLNVLNVAPEDVEVNVSPQPTLYHCSLIYRLLTP